MNAREIVLALKESGLTQAQIANATGLAQPTVSKIERGDVADVMSKSYLRLMVLHRKHCGKRAKKTTTAEVA